MNKLDYFTRLLPEIFKYKVFRHTGLMEINPFTLTFSVTAACQSRCKTCKIGDMYHKNPERTKEDLTVGEIESVFKTMKPLYFFNVSGGEPFLRDDLPEIVELACYYLKPRIVHIPTNALMPNKIFQKTSDILAIIDNKYKSTILTVKPSIDGIGEEHDKIRGVKGNFERLLETLELLKQLVADYDSFHLELGTVVSNYNIYHLEEIEDFVHSIDVESYRNEIAEQRAEFFNIGDPITPSAEEYKKLMKVFSEKIVNNICKKKKLARTTEALRLEYYQLSSKILIEKRQVIPCYAGISNVHINYDGGIWPCCVLGYNKEFGNLRDYNYDFQQLWYSDEARKIRSYIRDNNCSCPLANQAYSNMLLNLNSLLKVSYRIIIFNTKSF